jgi:hypothetical protein
VAAATSGNLSYATIRDRRYSQPLSRSGVAALSLYGNVSGFDPEAVFASPL